MRPPNKSRSRNKNNRRNNNNNGGNALNRVYDSSGPDGRVRGTPTQVIEKYQTLAHDHSLAGDRVAMEAFQQHAEHYIRVMNEAQRQVAERREQMESQNRNNNNDEQRAQNQQRNNQNSQNNDNSNGSNRNGGQPVADLSKAEQPDIVSAPAEKAVDNRDGGAKARSVPIEVVDNSGGLVETPESKGEKPVVAEKPARKRRAKPKPKPAVEEPAGDTPAAE